MPVLTLLALLPLQSARAGTFELNLRPSSRMFAGRVSVRIAFENRGDEVMRNVHPRVWFEGAWHTLPAYETLVPRDPRTTELDVGPAPALPGTYTAVVSIRYTDQNGHPFTTLETVPVYTGEPLDPEPLQATLGKLTLRNRGKLMLTLTAQGSAPLQASCRLVLPDELGGQSQTATAIDVTPGAATEVPFDVQNAYAVPGSRYRVFALVDYVSGGRHVSTVATGGITLAPRRTLSERTARRLWWIPAVLGVCWLGLQLRRTPRAN